MSLGTGWSPEIAERTEADIHGHARSPGQNNFHGFNCYRDNNHQLYDDGTHRCWSVYYCLGVSGCGMTFACIEVLTEINRLKRGLGSVRAGLWNVSPTKQC